MINRLFLLTLAILVAFPVAAQTSLDELDGLPIESVEVVGNQSVATDTIRVYLSAYPGDPFMPGMIQDNFTNLWQTGLFDDIRVEAEKAPSGGVILRIHVVERPRIGGVEFRGNKDIKTSDLQEALDRDRVSIHVGSTVEQTLIRRAEETIRSVYAQAGQDGIEVSSELEEMMLPGERRLVFTINEGLKARVAGVEFEGNERFSDRRLRRAMEEVKKHNVYTWIRKKNLYTPSRLEADLENIRNFYRDYGYKDVQLGEPRVVTLAGRKPRVRITVPVTEGEVHTFGSVSMEGETVFEQDRLLGTWPLQEGDVLQRRPIQARIDFIEELYQRRGYIYSYVDTEYIEHDDNVVDVKLNVFEGEQFRLGRLEFRGNSVTKDKVLRREIYLDEGDVMDMETFKLSLYKLGQLGYFKVTDNPEFQVNPEDKTVDILVRGKEEGKNDIQFGGGYSEQYGFFYQLQYATRNFLGEGESVGVSLQQGARQDYASLSYADPWFLDRPQSFGISLFSRNSNYPQIVGIDAESVGGSVVYGFRLDRFESVSFLYGYQDTEQIVTLQAIPDREGNVPIASVLDRQFTTSAIVPQYRYDSRNDPYDSTRGSRISLSVAYNGGPLGGTIDMIKPVLNTSRFHPLTAKSSISGNFELGQIFPFNDDTCLHDFSELTSTTELCVPQTERFFLGGEQSVRGFRSYSIGPREDVDGDGNLDAAGGYKYTSMNLEYVYKINDPIRFVVWADAGQAYGHEQDWDLGLLRYTTGLELRVFLPVFQFPLRFIYAFNPDEQPGDDRFFESFRFTLGNTF